MLWALILLLWTVSCYLWTDQVLTNSFRYDNSAHDMSSFLLLLFVFSLFLAMFFLVISRFAGSAEEKSSEEHVCMHDSFMVALPLCWEHIDSCRIVMAFCTRLLVHCFFELPHCFAYQWLSVSYTALFWRLVLRLVHRLLFFRHQLLVLLLSLPASSLFLSLSIRFFLSWAFLAIVAMLKRDSHVFISSNRLFALPIPVRFLSAFSLRIVYVCWCVLPATQLLSALILCFYVVLFFSVLLSSFVLFHSRSFLTTPCLHSLACFHQLLWKSISAQLWKTWPNYCLATLVKASYLSCSSGAASSWQ